MFLYVQKLKKKIKIENFLSRNWFFQMGLDFLCHFYQQLFSKSVDFEEKKKISNDFFKIENKY